MSYRSFSSFRSQQKNTQEKQNKAKKIKEKEQNTNSVSRLTLFLLDRIKSMKSDRGRHNTQITLKTHNKIFHRLRFWIGRWSVYRGFWRILYVIAAVILNFESFLRSLTNCLYSASLYDESTTPMNISFKNAPWRSENWTFRVEPTFKNQRGRIIMSRWHVGGKRVWMGLINRPATKG